MGERGVGDKGGERREGGPEEWGEEKEGEKEASEHSTRGDRCKHHSLSSTLKLLGLCSGFGETQGVMAYGTGKISKAFIFSL